MGGWGTSSSAPSPRDVLASLGIPVAPHDEVQFASEPVKYNGRLRVFIATRTMLVYARSPDMAQSLYNMLSPREWVFDWAAPLDNLAFVDDDGGSGAPGVGSDVSGSSGGSSSGKAGTSTVALLMLHIRARDAWLGDPSSTHNRPVAVSAEQFEQTREFLQGVMRGAGRVPELCWAERPTQTTMVIYLKRNNMNSASSSSQFNTQMTQQMTPQQRQQHEMTHQHGTLIAMLQRICLDHGLLPQSAPVRGDELGDLTHHCIRAVTPPGAPTAMEFRLRLGRHALKGDMLVVEYKRMEVEDAAWTGLQVAGVVFAVIAIGAMVTSQSSHSHHHHHGGGGPSVIYLGDFGGCMVGRCGLTPV